MAKVSFVLHVSTPQQFQQFLQRRDASLRVLSGTQHEYILVLSATIPESALPELPNMVYVKRTNTPGQYEYTEHVNAGLQAATGNILVLTEVPLLTEEFVMLAAATGARTQSFYNAPGQPRWAVAADKRAWEEIGFVASGLAQPHVIQDTQLQLELLKPRVITPLNLNVMVAPHYRPMKPSWSGVVAESIKIMGRVRVPKTTFLTGPSSEGYRAETMYTTPDFTPDVRYTFKLTGSHYSDKRLFLPGLRYNSFTKIGWEAQPYVRGDQLCLRLLSTNRAGVTQVVEVVCVDNIGINWTADVRLFLDDRKIKLSSGDTTVEIPLAVQQYPNTFSFDVRYDSAPEVTGTTLVDIQP